MTEPRYDIAGPGLVRALQKAVAAKKDLVIMYDYDNLGRILRVGYFFKDKGIKDLAQHDITWLDSSEIRITRKGPPFRKFRQASLNVEFTHPRVNERHFLLNLPLGTDNRVILRNLFRVLKDSIIGFVIQVEIRRTIRGTEKWLPVVRYDCAHGFIHRDMIASNGRKTKHKLTTQDTKSAITLATEEIQDNLSLWLHQLGYEPLDPHSLNQPYVIQEMDRIKSTLLELHDNPEKMNATQSTFTQSKDKPDYIERIWPPPL